MAFLAVAWWIGLLSDAVLGRTSWAAVVLASALVLVWSIFILAPRHAARNAAVASSARENSPAFYWRDRADQDQAEGGGLPWCDDSGKPVRLRVIFDLGRYCLLMVDHAGGPSLFQYRWVNAGHLTGPWRWRVMMASSLPLTSETTTLSNKFQRSAGRLA